MAWENLEAEVAELLSVRAPDLGRYTGEVAEREIKPGGWHDTATLRLQRKLLAKKRAAYGQADRNRTYTVRDNKRVFTRSNPRGHGGRFAAHA